MTNQLIVTSPMLAGQPVVNGNRVLSAEQTLSPATTTHTAFSVNSDLVAVALYKFGTLTNDCTLVMEGSAEGTRFNPIKTYTNADLQAGKYDTVQCKAPYIRFTFVPGTTTGSNGVKVRILD